MASLRCQPPSFLCGAIPASLPHTSTHTKSLVFCGTHRPPPTGTNPLVYSGTCRPPPLIPNPLSTVVPAGLPHWYQTLPTVVPSGFPPLILNPLSTVRYPQATHPVAIFAFVRSSYMSSCCLWQFDALGISYRIKLHMKGTVHTYYKISWSDGKTHTPNLEEECSIK